MENRIKVPKKQMPQTPFSMATLKEVVAALLVSGKLRVDAVTLFREATLVVELVGQYKSLQNITPSNQDKLVQFLDEIGGDMTLNDVIRAFQQRINS
ncbi:hypothetical protein [Paenibacillus sp. VT-400]|uniref:hypothetical protein n=1 Tax=Paenibacillus sp. VT-400 TaxID=1495853 RepID=UPI00069F18E7|nr:hypothetical protein [Paenibacillus sp. VT-400]